VKECAELQRITFGQFVRFLALEGITSAKEENSRLLWATERVVDHIVFIACDIAWACVDDRGEKAPAWLQELTKQVTELLDRKPDRHEPAGELWVELANPGTVAKPTPKVTRARTVDLLVQMEKALRRHLDRNRFSLIEEFLAPATGAHGEAKPELEAKGTSEDSHSDSVANLLADPPLGTSSKFRAQWVDRVLVELGQLRPQMRGYEGDYEAARGKYPHFLTIQMCERESKLKQKLVDIQANTQFKTFAKEIVAVRFSKGFETIKRDRTKLNKEKKKRQPECQPQQLQRRQFN
jgi:hypothetical protein